MLQSGDFYGVRINFLLVYIKELFFISYFFSEKEGFLIERIEYNKKGLSLISSPNIDI